MRGYAGYPGLYRAFTINCSCGTLDPASLAVPQGSLDLEREGPRQAGSMWQTDFIMMQHQQNSQPAVRQSNNAFHTSGRGCGWGHVAWLDHLVIAHQATTLTANRPAPTTEAAGSALTRWRLCMTHAEHFACDVCLSGLRFFNRDEC